MLQTSGLCTFKEYSMKKVALSLIALLAAGSFAFAEDTAAEKASAVAVTLSADASASWGVDLDTKVHGFSNGAGFDLELKILDSASTKTGAGDVHGYINIADLWIGGDAEDGSDSDAFSLSVGDITAKIVAGDLYVKLYTNTDAGEGYSRDVDDDNGGAGTSSDGTFVTYSGTYGGDAEWSSSAIGGFDAFDSTGVEVGYTIPSVAALVFEVGSAGDWTAAQQTDYDFSATVNLLAVEKLTLGAKAYYGKSFSADAVTAFGAEFAYDLGVLVPFANVNYELGGADYTLDAGAKAPLVEGLNIVAWAQYGSDEVANAQVTLDLAADKLAGPLSASVGARFKDITKVVQANTYGEVFAKVGLKATDTLSISASANGYNAYNVAEQTLFVKAGVDYTGISLTTLSVNYSSSDLGAAETTGDSKLGKLVFTAKVAY